MERKSKRRQQLCRVGICSYHKTPIDKKKLNNVVYR